MIDRGAMQRRNIIIKCFFLFILTTRNPDYYPNPDVFDPERFTEERRNKRNNIHYIPFLEGSRMCPGIRLAMTQMKAATMSIVRDFKVSLSPNHKPFELDPTSPLWQSKHGLLLNFTPRE